MAASTTIYTKYHFLPNDDGLFDVVPISTFTRTHHLTYEQRLRELFVVDEKFERLVDHVGHVFLESHGYGTEKVLEIIVRVAYNSKYTVDHNSQAVLLGYELSKKSF